VSTLPPGLAEMRDESLLACGARCRDRTGKSHPLPAGTAHFMRAARIGGSHHNVDNCPGLVLSPRPPDRLRGKIHIGNEPGARDASRFQDAGPGERRKIPPWQLLELRFGSRRSEAAWVTWPEDR